MQMAGARDHYDLRSVEPFDLCLCAYSGGNHSRARELYILFDHHLVDDDGDHHYYYMMKGEKKTE